MKSRSAALAFPFLLAGCFGLDNVEKLKTAPPAATAFERELSTLYEKFVDRELKKYDWQSAGYFAEKGLLAAQGKQIVPEDPAGWDIPDYAMQSLASARNTVMAKLTPAYKQQHPIKAASLFFHFDCWVEEQEEAWETEAIERCKQGVMIHLQETDPPVPMGGPLSTSYLMHFPQDETMLEGFAKDELSLIADTLADYDDAPYQVILNGHASREENKPRQLELSKQRANYIAQFLIRRGVAPEAIQYLPYGGTDMSAASAADAGADERVEIFIE